MFNISIEREPISSTQEFARLHFLSATEKKNLGLYSEALEHALQAQRLLGLNIWNWGEHRVVMVASMLQYAKGIEAAEAEFERLIVECRKVNKGNWRGWKSLIEHNRGVVRRRDEKAKIKALKNTPKP